MDLMEKTFVTTPADQGQIVEVSYLQLDNVVIRRTLDRSSQHAEYEYATSPAADDDLADYWNGAPANKEWAAVTAAKLNDLFSEDFEVEF